MIPNEKLNATYIYGLYCPAAGQIRYVGRSINPVERLRQHIDGARVGTYGGTEAKREWLTSLLEDGKEPELVVLQILEDPDQSNEAEISWMHRLLEGGANLVNRVPRKLEERMAEQRKKQEMLEAAIERGRDMYGEV